MTISVQINQEIRKPSQDPSWRLQLLENTKTLFDSNWYAIRLPSKMAAQQLNEIIDLAGPINEDLSGGPVAEWQYHGADDATSMIRGRKVHVEHLSGPIDGGVWFWSVENLDDIHDLEFSPKNMRAAKWLCEISVHA